jgi:hypothetical protein
VRLTSPREERLPANDAADRRDESRALARDWLERIDMLHRHLLLLALATLGTVACVGGSNAQDAGTEPNFQTGIAACDDYLRDSYSRTIASAKSSAEVELARARVETERTWLYQGASVSQRRAMVEQRCSVMRRGLALKPMDTPK